MCRDVINNSSGSQRDGLHLQRNNGIKEFAV